METTCPLRRMVILSPVTENLLFSTHLTLWTKFMHTSTLSQTGECACVISCCYFISDFFRVDLLSVTSISEAVLIQDSVYYVY